MDRLFTNFSTSSVEVSYIVGNLPAQMSLSQPPLVDRIG